MAHSPNYNPRNGSSASGRGGNSDAPLGSGADLVIRGAQNQPDAIQSGSQNMRPAVLGPPEGDEAAVRPGTNSPHSLPVVTNGTHDDLEQVYVAIMGVTGAGKSSFIKLCTESREVKVGHGLESCTHAVGEHSFVYHNKHVHLIDTPGFDDTTRSDREVLDDIATWLGTAYAFNIKLAGILYLHRVTDTRVGGVASSNLRMFKKLCGPDFYPRVTLVSTMWDIVDRETAEGREAELKAKDTFWGHMIDGGSKVRRHWNDRDSAMDILREMIGNRSKVDAPTHLKVQTEMVEEKLSINETSAGQELLSKILEERKRYERMLEAAKREMQECLEERDMKAADESKRAQEMLEAKLRQGYEDQQKLNVKFEEMVQQHRLQFEEMERKEIMLRKELEAAKVDLEKKQERLKHLSADSPQALVLRQQIADAEDQTKKVSEGLAEQEEIVRTEKKSLVNRISEWVKKNPKAVARAGMFAVQFVGSIVAARREKRAMQGHWQSQEAEYVYYEAEEVEEAEPVDHSVPKNHDHSLQSQTEEHNS